MFLKDGHVSSMYRAILWGFATPILWTPSQDEAQLLIVLRQSRAFVTLKQEKISSVCRSIVLHWDFILSLCSLTNNQNWWHTYVCTYIVKYIAKHVSSSSCIWSNMKEAHCCWKFANRLAAAPVSQLQRQFVHRQANIIISSTTLTIFLNKANLSLHVQQDSVMSYVLCVLVVLIRERTQSLVIINSFHHSPVYCYLWTCACF